MKYKFLDDLTSDVFFESYGKDLKELLENSALAMFEIICKVDDVEAKDKVEIDVKAEDESSLLFNWLQELIAYVDIEEMFFSRFNIVEISPDHLKAEIYGEPITKEKGNTVVKAITKYKFSLIHSEEGYKATVSMDI